MSWLRRHTHPAYFRFFNRTVPGQFRSASRLEGKRLYMAATDYEVTASLYGTSVAFHIEGPPVTWWDLEFFMPLVSQLKPGTYESAVEFGSPLLLRPKLRVSGDGRACSRINGCFVVLDAAYDLQGNLTRFAVDFEQHCDGAADTFRLRPL